MGRKGSTKGVKVVGSKSSNKKRPTDNRKAKSPRKRQKAFAFLHMEEEIKLQVEQPKTIEETMEAIELYQKRVKDQVFRFMDLPGELRNSVYEYAAEYAHRCFPPIFSKTSKPRRDRSWPADTPEEMSKDSPKAIPHIGLTHSCALIRSEFRPMWLSCHRIPLCALDGYLKVFFPAPPSNPEVRKRFESYQTSAGTLRIWVRKPELANVDIHKLLKHKTRFPDRIMHFQVQDSVPGDTLSPIGQVVDNKNPTWIKWIKGNIITQVRLAMKDYVDSDHLLRIVIKERYAPAWMRPTLHADTHVDANFVKSLGLDEVAKEWKIAFGVDYS